MATSTPARPARFVKTSLSDQAYEDLKRQILDQRLPPGTRLNIDALARDFGISSSPLREALVRLSSDGLVVSSANAGFSVAPVPSSDHVRELMEYRTMIEAHCARKGAGQIPSTMLEAMTKAVQGMADMRKHGIDYRQYRSYVELDNRFHQLIVDSAGNATISKAFRELHLILMVARLTVIPNSDTIGSDAGMAEHVAILEAFKHGDGGRAESAVRAHLAAAQDRLQLP